MQDENRLQYKIICNEEGNIHFNLPCIQKIYGIQAFYACNNVGNVPLICKPNIRVIDNFEFHSFSDMHAHIFRFVFSVNIWELAETESVVSCGIHEAIDSDGVVMRAHAECLADLNIV